MYLFFHVICSSFSVAYSQHICAVGLFIHEPAFHGVGQKSSMPTVHAGNRIYVEREKSSP